MTSYQSYTHHAVSSLLNNMPKERIFHIYQVFIGMEHALTKDDLIDRLVGFFSVDTPEKLKEKIYDRNPRILKILGKCVDGRSWTSEELTDNGTTSDNILYCLFQPPQPSLFLLEERDLYAHSRSSSRLSSNVRQAIAVSPISREGLSRCLHFRLSGKLRPFLCTIGGGTTESATILSDNQEDQRALKGAGTDTRSPYLCKIPVQRKTGTLRHASSPNHPRDGQPHPLSNRAKKSPFKLFCPRDHKSGL